MTPGDKTDSKPPLNFGRWLQSRGMNPSRRRTLGRQTVLWIEYRDYLKRTVGPDQAKVWFEKRAQAAKE